MKVNTLKGCLKTDRLELTGMIVFVLNIQYFITREYFNYLSPITLQLIIEGNRQINIIEWKFNIYFS